MRRTLDQVVGSLGIRASGLVATAGLSAFAVFTLVGARVLLHPAQAIVGSNPVFDYQIMTWSLGWWPWALGHGHDPFHTQLLWSPTGFSLLWMTSIPVPSLIALPLTVTAGPLVAYNVLMLAAVVLAACAAYLLCFELTERQVASAAGGLLFGLSPYMLGHTLSEHLNLTFVFPVPLLVLLVIRCAHGSISARRFVLLSTLLLLALAGSSAELFVDMTLVVVITGAIAVAVSRRGELRRVATLAGIAYGVTLVVLAPVAVIAALAPHSAIQNPPAIYEIDLLNPVVPTSTLLLGSLHAAHAATRHFVGNVGEQDGYVGLPLLLVAVLALIRHRRRGTWLLGLFVVVAFALSLGPVVALAGRPLVVLPFSSASLPLVGNALPARMSVFVALGFSCLGAIWFANARNRPTTVAAGVLVAVSLLPNFWHSPSRSGRWSQTYRWSTADAPSTLASSHAWKNAVASGTNVLVLPPRDHTAASYWQVSSGMRFGLAMPGTPFVPPDVAASPFVSRMIDGVLLPLDGRQLTTARLRAFLLTNDVRRVVVAPRAQPRWTAIAHAATSTRPLRVSDLLVFRVPKTLPALRCNAEVTTARVESAWRTLALARRVSTVRTWLEFDGARAHVKVRFKGRTTTLSSPGGDAESPAAALNRAGAAAVAYTEWRGGELLLRVATDTGSGWHAATLARSRQPIWSPQVAVAPNGTVLAAWVAETGSTRSLRFAARPAHGIWHSSIELERGIGFGSVSLATGKAGVAVAAWQDTLASESRVRAAVYELGQPAQLHTLTARIAAFSNVRVDGPDANAVEWRRWKHGRSSTFVAQRFGRTWARARPLYVAAQLRPALRRAQHPLI